MHNLFRFMAAVLDKIIIVLRWNLWFVGANQVRAYIQVAHRGESSKHSKDRNANTVEQSSMGLSTERRRLL